MVPCLRTPFGDHRVSPPRRKRVEPRKKTVSAPAPRRANETVKARRVHVNEHVSPAAPSNPSPRLSSPLLSLPLSPLSLLVPRLDRVGLRASSAPAVALASDGTATAPTSRPRLWSVGGRADRPHEVPRADERLCHVLRGAGRCTIGIGADARGSREMLSDKEMRQQAIRRKRGSTASSTADTVAGSFHGGGGHFVGGARAR